MPEPRASYVSGPISDHLWIILSPLLALAALHALWSFSGYSDRMIYAVLFAFIVTGHHMPGWLRAFGEPAVYARHKARLWVSLAAIPALVLIPTALGLGMVALCIAAAFDLWHVAMQQHGFGRIYGAKAGDRTRGSARLDLACVLVWYATVVAFSDAWMQAIASALRTAGIDLFAAFTPDSWAVAQGLMLIASAALLLAYIRVTLRQWREHRTIATHKHLVHLVAFAVLAVSYQEASWFRANATQNLFHAMQYFFMVWIFGSLSIRRQGTAPRAFYRSLFGSRAGILGYAFLIALYGAGAWLLSSSDYRIEGASDDVYLELLGSLGLASLLLHFYVDSFIWKVRARDVQTTLDITRQKVATAAVPEQSGHLQGAVHALTYFGAPTLLVLLVGIGARSPSPAEEAQALQHEAELFPASAMALAKHGMAELAAGRLDSGAHALEAAVDLAPSFDGPALTLADLAAQRGDKAAELRYLTLAAEAAPHAPSTLYRLGTVQAAARQLDAAETTLRRVIALQPESAAAHENIGVLYKWRDRWDQALPWFRRAHELDPDLSQAVCNLAGTLASLGHATEALSELAEYRHRHPADAAAEQLEAAIRAAAGK